MLGHRKNYLYIYECSQEKYVFKVLEKSDSYVLKKNILKPLIYFRTEMHLCLCYIGFKPYQTESIT